MKKSRTFYAQLRELLPNYENLPKKYKRLGNLVILRSTITLDQVIGNAVLTILPWAEGVFQHETTKGENRRPKVRHIAGNNNTVVIHHENHLKYILDISKTTFSAGNSELRRRLVHKIKDGDNVLDMFAAVGNLCLQPAAFKKINLIAVEKDKITYNYLLKTLKINNILNYETINADCRNICVENWADKIIMGYHWVDLAHMQTAVKSAKKQFILYIHPLAKVKKYQEQINKYNHFLNILNVTVISVQINKVKHYSPLMDHIELIYTCKKHELSH